MAQTKTDNKLCPVSKKCGGCQLWNLSYDEQLKFKQAKVNKLLGSFHRVAPIIGMQSPFHYRNKVQAAFGRTRSGEIISGVYQSSTHNIVKINECLIEDKKADEIIVTVRELVKAFKLTVFDEKSSRGFLRHVLVKCGFASGEIMVVLVTGILKMFSAAAASEYRHVHSIRLTPCRPKSFTARQWSLPLLPAKSA